MEYKIYAGLGGGFGGATYQYTDDFRTEEDALDVAYLLAVQEYESHEGICGLPSWEDVRDELSDSYCPDEEPSDDDIYELYLECRDNWLDYKVERVEEEFYNE